MIWYASTTSSSYSITTLDSDGKYYFYAVDSVGNKTETKWIELKVAAPVATVERDKDTNQYRVVWDGTATGRLNDQPYTKATWISQEGEYVFVITNSSNRSSTYRFTIAHCFVSVQTVEPTCTEQGYTVYKCLNCSITYQADYVEAKGHDYEQKLIGESCTEGAYYLYTCKDCGHEEKSEYLTSGGHKYDKTIVPPNCTDRGYTIYKCSVCGYTFNDDYVAAKGHNYKATVLKPTCTEMGYTTFSCKVCHDEYISDYTVALGHDYQTETIEATCTEKGCTLHKCSRCKDEYKTDETMALGHYYTERTIEVSCEENGCVLHTCTRCGYEYETNVVKALGHKYVSEVQEMATCTEDGHRHHLCARCGNSYVTDIPAFGHNYEITDIRTKGGETERTYQCSICGHTYVQELGDQYEEVSNYKLFIRRKIMFSKKFIGKIKQKMDSITDPVQFMSDLMAAKNQKTKASFASYFKEIQAINAEQDIAKKEQKMGDFFFDYLVAYGLKRMIDRNDENFQKISSLYNSADIYGDLDQMGFDDELSDLGDMLEDSDTEWDEYLEAANQVGEEAEPEAKEEEQPKAEPEKEIDEPKVEDEKEVNNAPVNDFMDDEEPEAEEEKKKEVNDIVSDEEEKEVEVIQPVEQADNSVEINNDKEPIQEKDDATIEIVPEKQQEPANEEPVNEEPVNEGPKPKYTQYLGNVSLKTTMVRQTRTVMNSFDGQPNEYYAFAKQRLNKVQEEYENDGFKDFREKLGVYTYLKKVHDGRKGMEWFKNIFTSIKERILMGKIEKSLKNDYGLNGDTLKEIYDNANEKLVFEQRENGIYCDTVANIESERNALQNNAPEAPQEQAEELNQEQFRKDVNMSISDLSEGEKSISESVPESQLNISKDSEKSV